MKYFLLIIICFVSSLASASEWKGKVIELKASTISRAVLFKLSGALNTPARCNEERRYAINLESPGGQAAFELIKYAYLNKLVIEATSLNTCVAHWKSEDVRDIYLK